MADIDEEFTTANAGASTSYPMQCSALRKGGHVLIKGRPCKIVEMSTSKTGKHGHAKVHMVGIDLFNGKKYEDICPSTHNMDVPNVSRKDYQFICIEDEGDGDTYIKVIDDDGTENEFKVGPGAVLDEIREKANKDEMFLVTVMSACENDIACGLKPMTK